MSGGGWTVPGYTHQGELGLGINGRVLLARHAGTETAVAIKYLTGRLCGDRAYLDRLRATTRSLTGLDDPHVVRLRAYVEGPRAAAIVLELVDGVTLEHAISAQGVIGPQAALVVLKSSLRGLSAVHRAGVVHGGYKPTNVLVTADGVCKVTDAGIAEPGLFAAGVPLYLAPERWAGRPATPATDLYAATAVFHECLTGRSPYAEKTTALLGQAHRTAPVPVDQVPEPLRRLLEQGLAKDPADRPPIAAFVTDLGEVATAAYGPDWERQGQDRLAELTAPLARLFPLARPRHAAPTRPALTISLRRSWAGATVGALLLGLATSAGLALAAGRQSPQDGPFTVHRVAPEPVASANPSQTRTPRTATTESNRGTGPRRLVPRPSPAVTTPDSPGLTVTPTPDPQEPGDGTTPPTGGTTHAPDPDTSPIIVPSLPVGAPSAAAAEPLLSRLGRLLTEPAPPGDRGPSRPGTPR